MSKSISAGERPAILIENVGGDLSLVGWEGADILIKGDEDAVSVQQDSQRVTFSSSAELGLRVPKSASVFIQRVGGDASVRGVIGSIEIKEVAGELSIRDVDSVAVDSVHADFSLRGAKGHVSLKSCGSDVSVRDVGGNVSIASVGDDFVLHDARGNVQANVGEDVVLYLDPKPENVYSVSAGDNILLVLPGQVNATLNLQGDEINVEWPGIKHEEHATQRTVVLGTGSAAITLKAGGDVRVSNRADAGESADEFGNFAGINIDFSGFGDRISRRVTERVERATERAHRKVDEVARRIEQKTREVERRRRFKGGVEVGRWGWDFTPKGVSMPPNEPVSNEERMAILKMLQEKKITAEEAEKLLAALEGGS